MRTVADELETLLLSGSYPPALRIEVGDFAFTLDEMSSCSNIKELDPKWTSIPGGRIKKVDHEEQAYTGKLSAVLSNADWMLNGVDLTGEMLHVFWGGYVKVDDVFIPYYSRCAPLRVRTHDNSSYEGQLLSHITCFSMMDELNHDKATVKFTATYEQTVEYLVEKILKAELEPYQTHESFVVVWDNKDALVQNVTPGPSFVIDTNETRLQSVARLLNMTRCVLRPGSDELTESGKRTFHIFKPIKSGSNYASTYQIEELPFYIKNDIAELVLPNHIIVRTPNNISPAIVGEAKDLVSIARYKDIPQTEYVASLTGAGQAQDIAEAILSNIQARRKVGYALTPIDFGLEVYDWVRILDTRQETAKNGNVGVLRRLFDSSDASYNQQISLGGWLDVKKVEMPATIEGEEPWKTTWHWPLWYVSGELYAPQTQAAITPRFPYITSWHQILAHIKEPADDDIIVDINIDGVSVHINSYRCTIPAGENVGSVTAMPGDNGAGKTSSGEDKRIPAGALLTLDIDQCGSVTSPGENLTVQMLVGATWDEE